MVRSYLIFLAFFVFKTSSAQSFDVDTLVYHGDLEKHINIVILGDGYQESELVQFFKDAKRIKDALFAEAPYSHYRSFFNVFTISTPSKEGGASHPGTASDVSEPSHPIKEVDNFFGASFDAFGIHRLLVPSKSSVIFNVLANNFPLYDQVLVVVNSTFYGGSGGVFATTSLNESATEIAIHELGHSFAGLIDEYYAGDQYAREGINMTAETDPEKVRWKNWMHYSGVGIYQHCCSGDSKKWNRPHENCKMRVLGPAFCPVCIEGTIESIHALVPAIDNFEPLHNEITGEALPMLFTVDYKRPEPNSMKTHWALNSNTLENTGDSLILTQDMLEIGSNEVLFTLEDQSELLRVDGHASLHTEFVLWEVDNNVSGLEEVSVFKDKLVVSIFPNPTQDYVTLLSKVDLLEPLTVHLTDLNGRLMKGSRLEGKEEIRLDVSDLPPGTYLIDFLKSRAVVASSKIVKH